MSENGQLPSPGLQPIEPWSSLPSKNSAMGDDLWFRLSRKFVLQSLAFRSVHHQAPNGQKKLCREAPWYKLPDGPGLAKQETAFSVKRGESVQPAAEMGDKMPKFNRRYRNENRPTRW